MNNPNPSTREICIALEHYRKTKYGKEATISHNEEHVDLDIAKPNCVLNIGELARIFVCILNDTRLNVVVISNKGRKKWINQSFPQLDKLIRSAIDFVEGS